MYVDLQLGAQGSSSLYLNTQKTTQFGLRLTEVKTNKDLGNNLYSPKKYYFWTCYSSFIFISIF